MGRMGQYSVPYSDVNVICQDTGLSKWFILRQMARNIDPMTFEQ